MTAITSKALKLTEAQRVFLERLDQDGRIRYRGASQSRMMKALRDRDLYDFDERGTPFLTPHGRAALKGSS